MGRPGAGAVRAGAAVSGRRRRRVRGGRRPGRAGWRGEVDPTAPHLLFDWRPGDDPGALAPAVAELAAEVSGPVEGAVCPHPGGPPSCWCRPPLPGLPMAFARAHGVEPARSVLVGVSAAHRTLATTLGARYVDLGLTPV